MSSLKYVRHEKINLKGHPEFNETWLRDRIVEDVSILGLGEGLKVIGIEKIQFKGGRLDLLLKDDGEEVLYEVELMLGKTDESHIIRTIEYWDKESRRFRDFDHCAVIVAEEITNRFFNVISLFNRFVPIIAIQLNGLRVVDTNEFLLHFTKVLDLSDSSEVDADTGVEGEIPVHDRKYWEERAPKDTLDAVDLCLSVLKNIEPKLELAYKKQFIGLKMNGQPNNFVYFIPKQKFTRVSVRVDDTKGWIERLKLAGLNPWTVESDRVLFRLTTTEGSQKKEILAELFQSSFTEWRA